MLDSTGIRTLALNVLNDHKAVDISDLDVTQLTSITDRVIICTATSTRHGATMADKLMQAMKAEGVPLLGVEGYPSSDWILIDLADIVVHIMSPEAREFYDLEKLWAMTEEVRKRHEN
jgi:ribosome-associated protein